MEDEGEEAAMAMSAEPEADEAEALLYKSMKEDKERMQENRQSGNTGVLPEKIKKTGQKALADMKLLMAALRDHGKDPCVGNVCRRRAHISDASARRTPSRRPSRQEIRD